MADPERRIRSLHGGRFRSLCPSVRPPSSGGLHGRDQQAVDRRSAVEPLPVAPGQPERVDEYVRNGVAQIFVEVEPLTGRSHVEAGERRTRQDWARWIEGMLERRYPEAERVVLVLDNLNTHGIESLYALRASTRSPTGTTTGNPLHAEARQLAPLQKSN